MKTTMKSLAGPDTIQVMLIGRKTGNLNLKPDHKVDITNMSPKDVGDIIRAWDYMKISWEYQIIQSYTFPNFDREKEGEE